MAKPPAGIPAYPMSDPARGAPLGDDDQVTSMVLMVRPDGFGHNPQTAATNPWQRGAGWAAGEAVRQALGEFHRLVDTLRRLGVRPAVVEHPAAHACPDAVFPNNWVSTHGDGSVVLYPLQSPNRRTERRPALLTAVAAEHQLNVRQVLDLSPLEDQGLYLEGTGSLVLDRRQGLAYAALSPRTHPQAIAEFSRRTGYRTLSFTTDMGDGRPVYHTNVLMSVGSGVSLVCADVVARDSERKRLLDALVKGGRAVVEITGEQMLCFAANCLELRTPAGPVTLISDGGMESLTPAQVRKLERHSTLCPVDVGTIEQVGGGSVRCMLAEIFLPGTYDRGPR